MPSNSKLKTKKNDSSSTGKGLIATGLFVAAAASVYYLYGSKQSKARRAKIKGWMFKMKGDVLEGVEKLKDVNEEAYNRVVDSVSEKYSKLKSINDTELKALSADLKKHWKNIKKEIKSK